MVLECFGINFGFIDVICMSRGDSMSIKPKRKNFIDHERLVAVLKQKGSPLPNASRSSPDGYWVLVAQAVSGLKYPSSKYTDAVYKYWLRNRDQMKSVVEEAAVDHQSPEKV